MHEILFLVCSTTIAVCVSGLNNQRRHDNNQQPKQNKRTINSPNTVNTPDTVPYTPDMNVETPDTPETPDTKTKIPDTKDTPESSGFEFLGSGDSSGYSEVESGTVQPVRFVANPLANVSDSGGKFSIQWKPYNKNTSKIHITGSDIDTEMTPKDQPKDAENKDMITEEINETLANAKPKPRNESVDKTMLDYFFDRYAKKSNILIVGKIAKIVVNP